MDFILQSERSFFGPQNFISCDLLYTFITKLEKCFLPNNILVLVGCLITANKLPKPEKYVICCMLAASNVLCVICCMLAASNVLCVICCVLAATYADPPLFVGWHEAVGWAANHKQEAGDSNMMATWQQGGQSITRDSNMLATQQQHDGNMTAT